MPVSFVAPENAVLLTAPRFTPMTMLIAVLSRRMEIMADRNRSRALIAAGRSSVEFSIPVEEIQPAVVQMIGWKFASHIPKFFSGGRPWRLAQMKPALAQAF